MPAVAIPANVPYRPYAICPPTNLMNPDGFFIINMGSQFIETTVVNTSNAPLSGVRVYIEGLSDLGIAYPATLRELGTVPAGASVPVRFVADFTQATPGAAILSIIVEAEGFVYQRFLKKIFITRVDYNKANKTYSVVMPEGTMRVRIHKAIVGPRDRLCDKGEREAFIALLKDVTYEWIPVPPYEGRRGPFPYQDPWWKIALAILAAVLLAGALLYDYFSDGTLDGGMVSVGRTIDETDPSLSCCTSVSVTAADKDDWLERGLYAAAGFAASAAIKSDGPDLHYRGQEATLPKPGELTLVERVHLKIDYIVAPSPGTRFPIAGSWKYTRITTGGTYDFSATDQRENLHWLSGYEVQAPATHDRQTGPLVVKARFKRPDGQYFKGGDLYVSGVLVDTTGQARRFELKDHGMEVDAKANDGWYSGGYLFRRRTKKGQGDLPGDWYLFVFAQDVNTVLQGTDPFTAAHTIGGFVLTSQLELNFDQPCTLRHDAVIHVV